MNWDYTSGVSLANKSIVERNIVLVKESHSVESVRSKILSETSDCVVVDLSGEVVGILAFSGWGYQETRDQGEVKNPAIGILVAAGMIIRGIVRGLSVRSANTGVRRYASGIMTRVGRCFSVKGQGGQRVLLGPDKVTVWYAGGHDGYDRAVNKFCR